MAAPLSGLHIPHEILSMILSYLEDTGPKFDIFCASSVCRIWYNVAFPAKFRRITLENVRHLDALTARLELENRKGVFRLSSCLCTLCVDIHSDDPHTQLEPFLSVLSRFQLVVKQLVNLEELWWFYYDEEFPINLDVLKAFRDSCPKLREVSITKSQPGIPKTLTASELGRNVFVFERLNRLAISWHDATEGLLDASSALIKTIEDSPDLSKLELMLSGSTWGWQPAPFFRRINNTLQGLVHLALGGYLEDEWYRYLDQSVHVQASLYSFWGQHSKLRALYLFAVGKPPPDFVLHPGAVERLFPSLIEFSGPFEMGVAIATSRLATQLETLFILPTEDDEDEISMHPLESLSRVTKPLPQLLELGFLDSGHPGMRAWSLNTGDLKKLFSATPRLKRIDFGVSETTFSDLFEPLQFIPELTDASIPDPELTSLADLMRFKFGIIHLINTHPRLGSIALQSKTDHVGRTLFVRRLFNQPSHVTAYYMY